MIRELKKELKKIIDPISEFAFEIIPQTKIFPHSIGELVIVFQKEGLYNISLEIDVWDKSTSTETVDLISEKIIKELDKLLYKSSNLCFACWFNSLSSVESDDKSIKRKKINFEIHARRGGE